MKTDMIKIAIIALATMIFSGCIDDRAGNDINGSKEGVLGVVSSNDRDGDGISNSDEVSIYHTNPDMYDSDGDGVGDGDEIKNGTNPLLADTDGDGISDGDEIKYGTNPLETDSDGDGISDGDEIKNGTNPLEIDSDGDGISDADEIKNGTNPLEIDSDGDGISDGDEIKYGTNPLDTDTDNDGLSDGDEIGKYDTNATNPDTDGDCLLDSFEILNYETNATNADSDGDNIKDGIEIYTYGSDLNESCLHNPETLQGGVNLSPAIDNIPTKGDVINALDSNNYPDKDGDGIPDIMEVRNGTDPDKYDTDGDGISDGDEIKYGTNPLEADSDGDGISDGDEIKYGTNPLETDSDNDGLSDGDEINKYDTNATNPDSDGDCLLDGFEILNYETNATNKDTDGDGVDDGIEIYSYDDIVKDCLANPERLEDGANPKPAMDNLPKEGDVINALDPTNDSDGDGQANIYENSCDDGDALSSESSCPYLLDGEEAKAMSELGYAYVPGGFDVDDDGVNETGFWISRYQARSTDIIIPTEEVIDTVDIINKYLSRNFKVLNKEIPVLSYAEARLTEQSASAGLELTFEEEKASEISRISSFTPYLAEVCMGKHKLITSAGKVLDLNVSIPTHKQYLHVKKLLDADFENGGDGRNIRNGLLGIDPHIPIFKYTITVDEFGADYKEYTRNLIQIRDINGDSSFDKTEDIPDWWEVDMAKYNAFANGANSTQDLGHGIGPEKDPYGVIVRGGSVFNLTQGVAGALTDEDGKTDGVSFRAATAYFAK